MEDYNADFLTMLETWEAAVKFGDPGLEKSEPLEIAHDPTRPDPTHPTASRLKP